MRAIHLKDFHLPKDSTFSGVQLVSICLAVVFFVLSVAVIIEKFLK